MKIDKEKLNKVSWYENNMWEEVDPEDPTATRYISRFPLQLTKTVYSCRPNGEGKSYHEMMRVNSSFASGEECIVAMVNSGDYALGEAITLYATSCERCNNALQYKYLGEGHGYPEFSEEWKKTNTECEYCKEYKLNDYHNPDAKHKYIDDGKNGVPV